MKHFCHILCLLLLWITQSIVAISYPVTPTPPTLPQMETTTSVKKKNQKKTKTILKRTQVTVVLGSGDEISGTIDMPTSLNFTHYKNGLNFSKTILLTNIKTITIQKYDAILMKKSKAQDIYQFKPSLIQITLTDKRIYRTSKFFSFLKKFSIDTIDGTTTLYSIFGDSYSQKDGWREVESHDRLYHKSKPHPKAVKKIILSAISRTGITE